MANSATPPARPVFAEVCHESLHPRGSRQTSRKASSLTPLYDDVAANELLPIRGSHLGFPVYSASTESHNRRWVKLQSLLSTLPKLAFWFNPAPDWRMGMGRTVGQLGKANRLSGCLLKRPTTQGACLGSTAGGSGLKKEVSFFSPLPPKYSLLSTSNVNCLTTPWQSMSLMRTRSPGIPRAAT